jgi:hypothetical protein
MVDYNATLIWWDPLNTKAGCNDKIDRDISFYFKNGKVINEERFHDNVGQYNLNLIDTTWTAVDWLNISHHTVDNGFDISTTDCLTNNDNTVGPLHGCTTTTNHGTDSVGNIYRDHALEFHPYEFDVSEVSARVGLLNVPLSSTAYIYMSNMSTGTPLDENMSLHLNGNIKAVGHNGDVLSNFVESCYAVGLDLNLSKSNTTLLDMDGNNIVYQSRFHNLDKDGFIILADNIDTNETNNSTPLRVQTQQGFFTKDLNGTMSTIHNFNYFRSVNSLVNPKEITLNNYDVNCTNPLTDCTIFADLKNDKTIHGRVVIDQNLTHYYGRTNAPRQRFTTPEGTAGNPAQALIYYEVHCDITQGCDKSVLQGGVDANNSDDPRWFINANHTADFGNAGSINKKGSAVGAGEVIGSATTGNHQDFTNLIYDGTRGYPYRTTMENNASRWLIYNKYNPGAVRNEFEVEFINVGSSWAGVQETNTTTNSNAASKTNRRSMW